MIEHASARKGRALLILGGVLLGSTAVMKVLVLSLDTVSGAQLFASQGLLAGFFFVCLGLIVYRRRVGIPMPVLLFAAFAIWQWARGIEALPAASTIRLVESLSAVALMFCIAHFFARSKASARVIIGVISGTIAAVAVVSFGQEFLSLPELRSSAYETIKVLPQVDRAEFLDRLLTREVFGPFTISNALAAFAVLLLFPFLGAYAGLFGKNKRRLAALAVAALALATLLLTRSKGGYIAAFIGAVVFLLLFLRVRGASLKKLALLSSAVAILVIGIPAALIFFGPESGGRASASVRLGYWDASLKMIADSPVTGHGYGTYQDIYPQFKSPEAGEVKHAHNDYIEITAESGLIGLALFLAALVVLLAKPTRSTCEPQGEEVTNVGAAAAGIVWLGLVASIVIFGAMDYDNILQHAKSLSFPWIAYLLLTLLLPPAAAYFAAKHTTLTPECCKWIRLGAVAGVCAFLAHSFIDFNFYNEGAAISFFAVAGLIAVSPRPKKYSLGLIVVAAIAALGLSVVASLYSRAKDEVSYVHHITNLALSNAKASELSLERRQRLLEMLKPADPPYPFGLPEVHYAKGELCEILASGIKLPILLSLARGHYHNAITLNPHRASYYRGLARVFRDADKPEAACNAFENALEKYPFNASLLAEYAELLIKMNRKNDAAAIAKRLIQLAPYVLPPRARVTTEEMRTVIEFLDLSEHPPPGGN